MEHKFNKSRFKTYKENISKDIENIISDIYAHINTFEEYELFINEQKTYAEFKKDWEKLEKQIRQIRIIHYKLNQKINNVIKSIKL